MDYNNDSYRGGSNYRGGNNRKNYNQGGHNTKSPTDIWRESNYQQKWIAQDIDGDFPVFAETIGKYMAENNLTNSKIRSIYGEMKRIQMGDYDKEKASFILLRPKVAYALGRDIGNKGLQLFKIMFDNCSASVVDKRTFLNFCNVFEAVLAYHRAYGGKD